MVREAAERVVLAQPREDVCSNTFSASSLRIFDDWQSYWADRLALLTVLQPQATRLGVGFRPFQAYHLATPTAGQRNLTNNVYDLTAFLLLGSIAKHPTEDSVLGLR
jgi:hypothetical protein